MGTPPPAEASSDASRARRAARRDGASGYGELVETGRIDVNGDGTDVAVVSLEGEHDIYTAPALRERAYGELTNGRALVVDLNAATFIDSSILGVLLGARRRAHDANLGFVVLCGANADQGVRRILDVTGLISVLPVLPDRDAAMQSARSGPSSAS